MNRLWIHSISGYQLFERQPLLQLHMLRFIDTAHAALGQQALNAITPANDGAWRQWHPFRHDQTIQWRTI